MKKMKEATHTIKRNKRCRAKTYHGMTPFIDFICNKQKQSLADVFKNRCS